MYFIKIHHLKITDNRYVALLLTIVTAGNLILGNLGTQVHKNHSDFHTWWVINKLKVSNFLSIFGQTFSKMLTVSGK